ncbi:ParA family protein [Corynebacterium sp. 320]|uniref:ParA family protein n=1 Tax=Corynebacterium TaxID=1716 RepID=UPI00125CB01F|nr:MULTISPECIES: ParA family protein [Corynebacterium]KAB1502810.1 ParA family protein [Corynebacterium sp. 320]KAB3526473.1 ParA family protein [Corynebacterium sp. 250]QNP92268.1 ParA family protein [Corynebacterium zhongnanshanii]
MAEMEWDDTPIARAARQAAKLQNTSRLKLERPERCRTITIANQKGGVGKTTSTVNLAWALGMHGQKVLVIDLDPQGNASTALGAEHRMGTPSSYEVLIGEMTPADAMQQNEVNQNVYCIPATIDLAGAEIELVAMERREYRLVEALNEEFIDEYGFDYIFIDCPPSLGLLTINAMTAVNEVMLPIQCEYYALEGVGQLLNNITMIRQNLNPELHISGVLLTMYDGRTKLSEQVSDEVRNHFGSVVLDNHIPRSVKVSEAPGYGQTVLQYDSGSPGALAYFDAAVEFAQRGDYLPTESTAPIGIAPELHKEMI